MEKYLLTLGLLLVFIALLYGCIREYFLAKGEDENEKDYEDWH